MMLLVSTKIVPDDWILELLELV